MFVYIFVIISAFRGSFGRSFAYKTCQAFSKTGSVIYRHYQQCYSNEKYFSFQHFSQTLRIQPLHSLLFDFVLESGCGRWNQDDFVKNKWIHQCVEFSFDLSLMWMDSRGISSSNPSTYISLSKSASSFHLKHGLPSVLCGRESL